LLHRRHHPAHNLRFELNAKHTAVGGAQFELSDSQQRLCHNETILQGSVCECTGCRCVGASAAACARLLPVATMVLACCDGACDGCGASDVRDSLIVSPSRVQISMVDADCSPPESLLKYEAPLYVGDSSSSSKPTFSGCRSGLVWFATGAGKCHYVRVVDTAPLYNVTPRSRYSQPGWL